MKIHTILFYIIILIMLGIYYVVTKAFGGMTDINIFYIAATAVAVLGYGAYVRKGNSGDSKGQKIVVAVCAVLVIADAAICYSFLPKYTYNAAKSVIEETYSEAKNEVDIDFPQFFIWDGEKRFSKGCYTFFYDYNGDLYVYNFDQYSGDNELSRILEDYNIETAAEEIVKGGGMIDGN